jgi:hypothetical protein
MTKPGLARRASSGEEAAPSRPAGGRPAAYPGFSEEDLARLWEGLRFPPQALATRDGQRLRVVYRGRRGAGPGPDFRDAVIATGGEPRRGDVELHLRASAFRHHGHHHDHRYDDVILHLVFEDDEGEDTPLACGRRAPVVALAPWVARRSGELGRWLARPALWEEPCRRAAERLGREAVVGTVERLGELRFHEKERRFALALASEDPEQVLYAGLLAALGYSQNQEAFTVLARLLPHRRLRRALAASSPASRALTAEALLLGAAGLLPSQRFPSTLRHVQGAAGSASAYVAELERRWAQLRSRERPASDEPPAWIWKLDGLRPHNHPVRRIAGAARLLARAEEGLLSYLLAALEPAAAGAGRPLIEAWTVPADGFWSYCQDLLRPAGRPAGALIGRGRALEIVVNVALPLAVAWARAQGDASLAKRALAIYRRLLSSGPYGATRFLEKNLKRGQAVSRSALFQQGLLHLFRAYCTQGGCGRCPLS